MKLSESALAVLKNFSNINSGVVLQPGTVQKTISPEKSILVEAELEEITDNEFGIYDLNQFLGNVTTLNNPELTFTDKTVTMNDGSTSLTYFACSPELVITPPSKNLVLNNPEAEFDLANATLTKLVRLASMNGLPNLSIVGKSKKLLVKVHEKNNDTSNEASAELGPWGGEEFTATFAVENLKLIPDDYKVEVKLGAFAKFIAVNKKLTYHIALVTK
jgi:hypothetical protein